MHLKLKALTIGGLFLAITVICMALGSVIETNTLFLLAAASYFIGIIVREFGLKSGAAFYLANIILGFLTVPNKFYVLSFAAMGFYIWCIEAVWRILSKGNEKLQKRYVFWILKYIIFNIIYLSILFLFQELLFEMEISAKLLFFAVVAGQIGLWIYDTAYEYVQGQIWNKFRNRLFH